MPDQSDLERLGLSKIECSRYFQLRMRAPDQLATLSTDSQEFLGRLVHLGLAAIIGDRFSFSPPISLIEKERNLPARRIHAMESDFQRIELFQMGADYFLTLNGEIQSHSKEHRMTHDFLVTLPMVMAREIKRVLILGGGDGHPARHALAFPEAEEITLVELDPAMIELTRNHPVMRAQTNDAFRDPRAKLIAGDAIRYLLESKEKYDVIIDDVEYFHTRQPEICDLRRYIDYLKAIPAHLTPGGVGCTMDPLDSFTRQLIRQFIPVLKACDPQIGEILRCETRLSHRLQAIYSMGFEHLRFQVCPSFYLDTEHYTYISNEPIARQWRELPTGTHFSRKKVAETLASGRTWKLRPGEVLVQSGPRYYRFNTKNARISRRSFLNEKVPTVEIALDPVLQERLRQTEAEHAWAFEVKDRDLYEKILETHASRSYLNTAFEQTPVLPHTAYLRTQLVPSGKKQRIVLIGDDDLLSIPLALSGHEVTVLELDEVTIAAIEHFKRKWDLRDITVKSQNLCEPIDPALCGQFDLAFLDPLSTYGCINVFLSRAVSCLKPDGHLWLALAECGEALGKNLAAAMGLSFQKLLRNFNHYYRKDFATCRYVSHYLQYQMSPGAKPLIASSEKFTGDIFAFEESYDYHATMDYYDCDIFATASSAEIIRKLYEVGPEGTQIVIPAQDSGTMSGFLHWGDSSMRIRLDSNRRWVGIDLFPVSRQDLFFWQPRIREVLGPKSYVANHSERNPGHRPKRLQPVSR